MRKFWGFYDNGRYKVGCSGASVYVYDAYETELCKFRAIPYTHFGAFQPGTNIFVSKSAEGKLAVYDLDRKELLRRITVSRYGDHQGFAFSKDGKLLYSIEALSDSLHTELTVYETANYTTVQVLFSERKDIYLQVLELSEKGDKLYSLGYFRTEQGYMDKPFIAIIAEGLLTEVRYLGKPEYDNLLWYKKWQDHGFTDLPVKWWQLDGVIKSNYTLENVHGTLDE